MGLSRIAMGLQNCLFLGNLNAMRDWGHAEDYVKMQWMMLQQEEPKDYVIATGEQFSVRDFVHWSAEALGINIEFSGNGENEIGIVASLEGNFEGSLKVGDEIIKVDSKYYRPSEVETLLGDPGLAKLELGWEPEITVRQMCKEMIDADLKLAKQELLIINN